MSEDLKPSKDLGILTYINDEGKKAEIPFDIKRSTVGEAIAFQPPNGTNIYDPNGRNTVQPSSVSYVDPTGDLTIRGISMKKLIADFTHEEAAYLTLKGEVPLKNDLAAFKKELVNNIEFDTETQEALKNSLKYAHKSAKPMGLLQKVIGVMQDSEDLKTATKEERYKSNIRMMAVMPTLMALVHHHENRGGVENFEFAKKEDFGKDGKDFSQARNLATLMHGKDSPIITDKNIALLDKGLTIHADHGNNLSTATGEKVGSGESKKGGWRSIAGATAALAGDKHGAANRKAYKTIQDLTAKKGDIKTIARKYVDNIVNHNREVKETGKGEKILAWGIGHGSYKVRDPRSVIIQELIENSPLKDTREFKVAKELINIYAKHEDFGKKGLHPNVDFLSGVLFDKIGIPENLLTVFFEVGRSQGQNAHIDEQKESGQIQRSAEIYTGETEKYHAKNLAKRQVEKNLEKKKSPIDPASMKNQKDNWTRRR